MHSETHSGEDVVIYAHGPMAHLFTGTHEQNFIAHAMAYASCVGANQNHCSENEISKASSIEVNVLLLMFLLLFLCRL